MALVLAQKNFCPVLLDKMNHKASRVFRDGKQASLLDVRFTMSVWDVWVQDKEPLYSLILSQ